MKRIPVILLCLILIGLPTAAKDKKFSFDEKAAWSYIKDMATDAMQGRRSGQPGGVMGEDYIASRFREWGLEPAGDDGTYFQNFTIEHRNIGQGAALEIWTDRLHRGFDYRDDWRAQSYSGSGSFVAEIVFVGYGLHAPDLEYDDYADVDVKGKLVMLTTGVPTRLMKKIGDAGKMENRIRAAREKGALGVIGFIKPRSQERYFYMRLPKEVYDAGFVILSVEENVSNFVFEDLPTDLRFLYQEIDRTGKPQSLATGVKAFLTLDAVFDPERETRNVLAKITGSDPKLREETVVIGGHMDHLGISPSGDVYNGANDNASGTAVVMEIARVMKLNREKPKRTVVFAAWAGEEQGLLGSRWYCDHPPLPIEKTVTYINMDMVGHGSGKVPFRGVYYGPQVWDTIKSELPKEMIDYIKPGRGGPGGSDHTPFLNKGVPAYAVMTEGYHFKYHRTRDDIDLIKPEILKRVGDFVLSSTRIMADAEGDFILPRRHELYHFNYQILINHKLNRLAQAIEHRKDVKAPHVDLQLSLLEEKEELAGDALRLDLLNQLFAAEDAVKSAKSLRLFTTSARLSQAERAERTTLMPGLSGVKALTDAPKWAEVLAGQGLYFLKLDDPAPLFGEEGLGDRGRELIKAAQNAGLLLMVGGLDDVRAKALLEAARKPLIILSRTPPSQEVLDLVKEKKGALGLILGADTDVSLYFKDLEKVLEAVGGEHLAIVNEGCLWKEEGKTRMLDLVKLLLGADLERGDSANLISRTFLRVLNAVRNGD